jgi:hypothetical protein
MRLASAGSDMLGSKRIRTGSHNFMIFDCCNQIVRDRRIFPTGGQVILDASDPPAANNLSAALMIFPAVDPPVDCLNILLH